MVWDWESGSGWACLLVGLLVVVGQARTPKEEVQPAPSRPAVRVASRHPGVLVAAHEALGDCSLSDVPAALPLVLLLASQPSPASPSTRPALLVCSTQHCCLLEGDEA